MKLRKGLVLVLALMFVFTLAAGCGPPDEEPPPPADDEVEEQVLIGEGQGYADAPIVVEVTMLGDEITAIEIVEHEETDDLSDPAFEEIPDAIIDAQSSSVDAVSGATETSEGIMEAVANATGM